MSARCGTRCLNIEHMEEARGRVKMMNGKLMSIALEKLRRLSSSLNTLSSCDRGAGSTLIVSSDALVTEIRRETTCKLVRSRTMVQGLGLSTIGPDYTQILEALNERH